MSAQQVSVLKCDDYVFNDLKAKVLQSLVNIGYDPEDFQGKKVALKPNLLIPATADRGIITHHDFFRAVAVVVKDHGGTPVLIESPSIHSVERVIKKTDYAQVVESEGIEVASLEPTKPLNYQGGRQFKQIQIAEAFFDADIIINLPKFKTHGLTYMTGAVKNLFGAMPGLSKSRMHVQVPEGDEFSEFLLDLYGAMLEGFEKPKTLLHLMDGIIVMEGEGPGTAGTPARMNAILASRDAVALDYVATDLAGLDVEKAFTVIRGFARDFAVSSPDDIDRVGDGKDLFDHKPLRPSKGTIMSNMIRWPINSPRFKNWFIDRPLPGEEKCTLCYQCMKICPAKAISKANGKKEVPSYDYDKCIRCYCCMEVCPEAAIEKTKGRLQWLLRF